MKPKTLIIDGKEVAINGERNLLEVIRKAGIDLPTFCYHSDLSVYGACRLCLVNVEGRGIMAACSTQAEPGMKVKTTTEEIREIRKIAIELLLANHSRECPTCGKSAACQLQELARKLGVQEIRFRSTQQSQAIDKSSPSLVRDPNKCVLCGDCVRMCEEVQGIGAIDFAFRGSKTAVLPAFGKDLDKVECVYCGQCSNVCPTGALTPKSDVEAVWKALSDPAKTVVAQIAPAVRVGLGEVFGMEPGTVVTGQMAAALRMMGFKQIYDTSFTADLTVIEEATEFLQRKGKGEKLPQFTSCCPGWVKYAEQYYPSLLANLSSCKSPQQMFGSLAREILPEKLAVKKQDLVIVSIMPCTAKKFEAQRPEFSQDGVRDVDFVLTTQELAQMIEGAGIRFQELRPESLDMPLGFKTGAGVIFGNSGGVTEAVLRYAAEKVTGVTLESFEFQATRGESGLREATVELNGQPLTIAIVHGLANAKKVAEEVKAGKSKYDLIEVMACPGGCIGGAGQPINRDSQAKKLRTRGLYEADKMLQLHKSQENHFVTEIYKENLGEVGGHKAHHLLHTEYHSRRRISDEDIALVGGKTEKKLRISVCVGTNCIARGSQDLLHGLIRHVEAKGLTEQVEVRASFCFEQCSRGPTVTVAGKVMNRCNFNSVVQAMEGALAGQLPASVDGGCGGDCGGCKGKH